jgi:hypothetical protein
MNFDEGPEIHIFQGSWCYYLWAFGGASKNTSVLYLGRLAKIDGYFLNLLGQLTRGGKDEDNRSVSSFQVRLKGYQSNYRLKCQ